jgi:hypothetical protein
LKSLLVAAALAAGAGAALEVTPARTEAAGYAITHWLLVLNLARNCEPYAAAIGRDPMTALRAWRQRNAERVNAAEAYFVFARAAVEKRGGASAGEDFHAQTHGLFVEQANTTLNEIFGAAGPQPAVCRRWVEAIAEGESDLNWQSKYMPLLDELVEFERSLRPGR